MTPEASVSSKTPEPSMPPLKRFFSSVSSAFDRFKGRFEHQVVGLLLPENIKSEGLAITKEVAGMFKDLPEYSHARGSARTPLRNKRLSGENVSDETVIIHAGFPVGDQRVTLTVTEDSEEAPLSFGMKVQGLNAESQDPALSIKVETRKSVFLEPRISCEDHRSGGIPVNPNTEAAVAGIRERLAELNAKLPPKAETPK